MSSLHHARPHPKFNAHDLESMRASDAASDEREPKRVLEPMRASEVVKAEPQPEAKRDPACVGSHVANCKCVGAARGPIVPLS